ncbi:MAG TPA: FAD/NAD(P)-binding protein, partial [Sphingomicrobium sp.]|nr:FAD/NAD(P)-binding protein [Sphingomicrobium sp.]
STSEQAHLLNVPAAKMSAWAGAPDHFAESVAKHFAPEAFVPRARYGAYLQDILAEAQANGLVEVVESAAVSAAVSAVRSGDCWRVRLEDGREVGARVLILAQGNQPPEPMAVAAGISSEWFVNNPWRGEAAAAVGRVAGSGGSALILGTGLTMVDMVLSLDAAGHSGRIVALSRRGQVPRAHADFTPVPVAASDLPMGDLLALWRWLRERAAIIGWRAAVDGLRPHNREIWRGLSAEQQRQFLRHARPWWDVHRHRIAPQIAERLRGMVAEGRLEIVAGRLRSMCEDGAGLTVEIARRGGESREEQFAVAFNCTGPLGAMARTRDPLLRQMIDDGLIAIDQLGMGIAVDEGSRAGPGLWALGPLTKGVFWEIVAVPDIREQVAQVAADVAREIDHVR